MNPDVANIKDCAKEPPVASPGDAGGAERSGRSSHDPRGAGSRREPATLAQPAHTASASSTAPKYGRCPVCGDPIHNRGAHMEACRGNRVFTGQYQCGRLDCLAVSTQGGLCSCGGRRFPLFRKARQ